MDELTIALLTRRLTGEISPEEDKLLDEKFAQSQELQQKYDQLKAYWDTTLLQNSTKEAWQSQYQRSISAKTFQKRNLFWYAAASVIVIVLVGAFFFFSKEKRNVITDTIVHTQIGEKRMVLPDGSLVVLNSNSKLTYDSLNFARGNRNVTFEGEGYFDIHHDTAHPFLIHISSGIVKVLGTAFNINSYKKDKEAVITLLRGKISFQKSGNNALSPVILKPNQKLLIQKEDSATAANQLKIINLQDIELAGKHYIRDTTWLQDKVLLKNDRLGDILPILEHKYNVVFRVEDNSLNDYVFSGELGNNSLEQILHALSIVNPFTYTITNGEVILSK